MRATTSTFGVLALVLAATGIARASGIHIDVRIFVVIALLATSAILALSALVPRREKAEDPVAHRGETPVEGGVMSGDFGESAMIQGQKLPERL
ncbi:hypothetical protein [Trueperella pecoris]|uniref:Uncharacterized protein n=1 Tax=Trueperella pecoris TaxID=2733571 RepID=A0A7M1QX96_9ACTO|nr:hypothetical protein [Trueperella pecoris]QOQ38898.1 hypothetical protein HLG82_05185 [Trueperella pecoris]QOR46476.1 hypothetical protein INS88_04605 [Trueperella pecoris]QTG76301.1 hypothetical protein J4179_04530 [Trueperella pecoris]